MQKRVFVALMLLFSAATTFAQLHGTYTIGTGGDFENLAKVLDTLNKPTGIDGNVIFEFIADGGGSTHNETLGGTTLFIGGSNSKGVVGNCDMGYSITFRTAAGVTTTLTAAASNAIRVRGSKNITFEGINFVYTGTGATSMVSLETVGSFYPHNIAFSNCSFNLSATTTNAVSSPSNTYVKGISFKNTTFIGGARAIYLLGIGASSVGITIDHSVFKKQATHGIYLSSVYAPSITNTTIDTANTAIGLASANAAVIRNTTITDAKVTGIDVTGSANVVIEGNTITNQNNLTAQVDRYAIHLTNSSTPNINCNQIHYTGYFMESTDTKTIQGIALTNCSGTAQHYAFIANNIIDINEYLVGGSKLIYGLNMDGANCSYFRIYYNSIEVGDKASTTNATAAAYNVNATTSSYLYGFNNIFSNQAKGYSVYMKTKPSNMFFNYNDYYSNGATLGYVAANCADLAALKSKMGLNAASISVDPVFQADFTPGTNDVRDVGTPNDNKNNSLSITTDIEGNSRNSVNPDLGAREWSNGALDAGVSSIKTPCGNDLQDVWIKIKNYGTTPLTKVTITYSYNGSNKPDWVYNFPIPLAAGEETDFMALPVQYQPTQTRQTILVSTSQPNDSPDDVSTNDACRFYSYAGFRGSYTVGGGGQFANIEDVLQQLLTYGICDDVVFYFQEDQDFTQSYTIGNTDGSGSGIKGSPDYSITFESVDKANPQRFIFYEAEASLLIDGVGNVIFRNITFESPNSTGTLVRILDNETPDIVFDSCRFDMPEVPSATKETDLVGIAVSRNSKTSNLTIRKTTFTGGSCAIYAEGSSNRPINKVTVENNTFDGQSFKNVMLRNVEDFVIAKNEVNNSDNFKKGQPILLFYADSCSGKIEITANRIILPTINHNRDVAGVYLKNTNGTELDKLLIANNIIDLQGVFGTSYTSTPIYLNKVHTANVYHNTCRIVSESRSTSSTRTAAYYNTSDGCYNLDIRNNIFMDLAQGYAAWSYASSSNMMDYNDYYVLDTLRGIVYYSDVAYKSAASMKGKIATGSDVNSYIYNPDFAPGTYQPSESSLADKGYPLSTIVPVDIEGIARSTTQPDFGAIEWDIPDYDAGIADVQSICDADEGIYVKIKNYAIKPLNDVKVYFSVDGAAPQSKNLHFDTPIPFNSISDWTLLQTPLDIFRGGRHYNIKIWTDQPNDHEDEIHRNDTLAKADDARLGLLTYTIGGTNPDYATFTAAVDSLKKFGICGPVVFNVRQGTYTEQITLPLIDGASTTNTITFQADPANTSDAELTHSGVFAIKFNSSAAYYIWKDLHIITTSTGSAKTVDFAASGVHDITFEQCTITSASTNSSSGCVYTSTSGVYNNVVFTKDTLVGGYYGIYMNGSSTGFVADSSVFRNQTYGTQLNSLQQPTVTNNTYTTNVATAYGISLSGIKDTAFVMNNSLEATNPTSRYYAIQVASTVNSSVFRIEKNNISAIAAGNVGDLKGVYVNNTNNTSVKADVINNSIIFSTTGKVAPAYAIQVVGNYNTTKVYHNTVYIKAGSVSSASYAMYASNGSHDIQNNLFITQAPSSIYTLYLNNTSIVSALDYNNYYTTSTAIANIGGSEKTTFAALRSAISGKNTHSSNIDPNFASETDLVPTAAELNSTGTSLGVGEDINGVVRSDTYPDMGAREWSAADYDAAVIWIDPYICDINDEIRATIINYGNETLTNVKVKWTVDGVAQTTHNWTGSLESMKQDTIILGKVTSTPITTSVAVVAWTEEPNGEEDELPRNDTARADVKQHLSGTYTIGGTTPDFANFTEAANKLISVGVCGPVVFNVRQGKYTEQITLPLITGSSEINTITFQADPANTETAELTHNGLYAVKLNNAAAYFIWKDLKISTTSTGAAKTIDLASSGLHDIVFEGCNIASSSTNSSSGCVYTSVDGSYDNIVFRNDTLDKGYYGIYMRGAAGDTTKAPVVEGCEFRQQTYGTYMQLVKKPTITGNTYTTANISTAKGIYLTAIADTAIVRQNTLENNSTTSTSYTGIEIQPTLASSVFKVEQNEVSVNTGAMGTVSGIYLNGSTNSTIVDIINNSIGVISSAAISTVYGVYTNGSNGTPKIYHNTVVVKATSVGNKSAAMYSAGNAASSGSQDIQNNIFVAEVPGSGNAYSIYFANLPTVATLTLDYNNYYVSSTNLAAIGNTNYATFSALTTAIAGKNTNSTNANPQFISDVNLTPRAVELNNTGKGLGIMTDIDGKSRNATTPDMGAREWTAADYDASIESVETIICRTPNDIKVAIANLGDKTLTSLTVAWTADGVPQTPYVWTGTLASTERDTVTLGQVHPANPASKIKIVAWAEKPNGEDEDASTNYNDTCKVEITEMLSGTYTIGGTSPDFESFKDAVDLLNEVGICGPVIFNARPGSYTENSVLSLNNVLGSSTENTITFQSENGNNEEVVLTGKLTYTTSTIPGADGDFVVRVKGTPAVTFKDMTIKVEVSIGGTTTVTDIQPAKVFRLENAHNFTLNGCIVEGVNSSSKNKDKSLAALVYTTSADTNLTFISNLFSKGSAAIHVNITEATQSDITIRENAFLNQRSVPISLKGKSEMTIERNTILTSDTKWISENYVAMDLEGMRESQTRASIVGNTIKMCSGDRGIGMQYINGTAEEPIMVMNNTIGITSAGFDVYGLYFATNVSFARVYNNSISIEGDDEALGVAVKMANSSDNEFNNNILRIHSFAVGSKRELTTFAIDKLSCLSKADNNVYVNNLYTNNKSCMISVGSTKYSSMSDWRNANGGLDTKSVFLSDDIVKSGSKKGTVDFTSVTDLHIAKGSTLNQTYVIGKGASLTGVTVDIDEETRPASKTTIGADEYNEKYEEGTRNLPILSVSGPAHVKAHTAGLVFSIPDVLDAYQWTVPDTWAITEGNGTNRITVTSGSIKGTVCVAGAIACDTVGFCREIDFEADPCETPLNLRVTIGNPANGLQHAVKLQWDSVTVPNTYYTVEYSADSTSWTTLATDKEGITSYNHVLADIPNEAVYFRVMTKEDGQTCSWYGVKGYTACDNPETPIVSDITSKTVSLSLNAETPKQNPSYTGYAIYDAASGLYVQEDGSFAEEPVYKPRTFWDSKQLSVDGNTDYCLISIARNEAGDERYSTGKVLSSMTFAESIVTNKTAVTSADWYMPSTTQNECTSGGWYKSATGGNTDECAMFDSRSNELVDGRGGWNCHIRSPKLDFTGQTQATLVFDIQHDYVTNATDKITFLLQNEAGTETATVTKIAEDGDLTVSGTDLVLGKMSRDWTSYTVTFDLSNMTDLSGLYMTIQANGSEDMTNIYYVRIDNISVQSGSNEACFRTPASIDPTCPTVTPADGGTIFAGDLLMWTDVDGAQQYEVHYAKDIDGDPWIEIATELTEPEVTFPVDACLEAGTAYKWKIVSVSGKEKYDNCEYKFVAGDKVRINDQLGCPEAGALLSDKVAEGVYSWSTPYGTNTETNLSVDETHPCALFQWEMSVDGGATYTEISGATAQTYTTDANLTQTTWFRCKVWYSATACPGVYQENEFRVIVDCQIPDDVTGIAGDDVVCTDIVTYPIHYSAVSLTDADDYQWTLPDDWQFTGNGTKTISVTKVGESGTIQVVAKNECTDITKEKSYDVFVGTTPAAPTFVPAMTEMMVCPNSEIALTVEEQEGTDTYTWVLPAGWQLIEGQDTRAIRATTTTNTGWVVVTANNICGSSIEQKINVSVYPTIDGSGVKAELAACLGEDFTLTASNGRSYHWTGVNGFASDEQNPVITGATTDMTGDYVVVITDANNCSAAFTTHVTVDNMLQTQIITYPEDAVCPGTNPIQLAAVPEGGEWSVNAPDGLFTPEKKGKYTVSYVKSGNCGGRDEVEITVFGLKRDVFCTNEELADLEVEFGDANGYWEGEFLAGDSQFMAQRAGLGPHVLYYTFADGITTCAIDIQVNERIRYTYATMGESCTNKGNGKISVDNVSGGESPYMYQYGGDTATVTYNHTAYPLKANTYDLIVSDINGCTTDTTFTIDASFDPCGYIYVPNVFYPNDANETNREARVFGTDIAELHFVIYDRWGKVMFETDNLEDGWNGRQNGQELPSAVFIYMVDVTYTSGISEVLKGTITLVR